MEFSFLSSGSESRLQLELKGGNKDFCLKSGGINILIFGDLLQIPPVTIYQILCQHEHVQTAVNLCRLITLVELGDDMKQQGDTTFLEI